MANQRKHSREEDDHRLVREYDAKKKKRLPEYQLSKKNSRRHVDDEREEGEIIDYEEEEEEEEEDYYGLRESAAHHWKNPREDRCSRRGRCLSSREKRRDRGCDKNKLFRERCVHRHRNKEGRDTGRSQRSRKTGGHHNHHDGRSKQDEEEVVKLKQASLQQQEDEDEDVNRIKEESRKRTQAILEKYRLLQKQAGEHPPEDSEIEEEKDSDKPTKQPDVMSSDVVNLPPQNEVVALKKAPGASARPGLGSLECVGRSEVTLWDDIFGEESPASVSQAEKRGGLKIKRSGFNEDWDDEDGYFVYRGVELVLCGRYQITAAQGKGVFSSVVRAKDLKAQKDEPEQVAIKIIRDKDYMFKAGLEELKILNKLAGRDPEDRYHCVRCISSFKYGKHLCLVFESLHMNLREFINKFCKQKRLGLTAVREHAKQLFMALMHLKQCAILQCDVKPENILVNEAKNVLKLCDFGNSMHAENNEATPYLVSRFYRSPEVILGLSYGHAMDIWSAGCCLWELYSGEMLFPGATNHVMLHLHMELKGAFPKKMLRKGVFTSEHFDHDLNFYALEEGLVRKKPVTMLVDIKHKGSASEDPKLLASFKDLLEKIFMLDPEKRMTVSKALNHPFITGK